MPRNATTLGIESRYRIIETIGTGAAATVHKVRDRRDGAVKATKLLHHEHVAEEETVRRFEDEFRILRGLHHPSLPEVHDYGWTADGSRYIVMEFVDGQPLDRYLQEHPDDLWVVLYELCEVLTFIHSHNLLHQDVKPHNILVKRTTAFGDEMPLVVLIDFGLTFRRDAGHDVTMVGTPAYMAPEIIRGETPLTRAVDYYSLGVTLYELIVGHLPFQGSGRDVLGGHLNQEVRFEREKIEYAELYPHIRGLMTKDKRKRLEAFEEFKGSVIGRMTGGIDALERAYGLAHIGSLDLIGKDDAWKRLMAWVETLAEGLSVDGEPNSPSETSADEDVAAMLSGAPGSGKTHLIRRVCAELSLLGLATLSLEDIFDDESDAAAPAETRYMNAWSKIQDAAGPRGVVVVADDADLLEESSREFLLYILRRYNISRASGESLRLNLITAAAVMQDETVYQEVKRHGASFVDVRLLPLQSSDHAALVEALRTRILEHQDAANLQAFLGRAAHNAGDVFDSLRAALLEGTARFHGGRWRFQLPEDGLVGGAHDYYEKLVTNLSHETRQVLFTTACHLGPLDVHVLRKILELGDAGRQSGLERLQALGLVQLVDGGRHVTFPSEGLRERIYRCIPSKERQEIHRRFQRVVDEALQEDRPDDETTAALCEQQSFHLEVLGEPRQALRFQLRALRCWMREENIFGVRRASRRSVELCDRHDSTLSLSGSARLLKRFAVRSLLNAEWRQSNLHRVREVIETAYVHAGNEVPLSFIPKYARALQAVSKLVEAKAVLAEGLKRINKPESVSSLQMRIELSLVFHQSHEIREALGVLDGVSRHVAQLDDYYRCRVYIHYAICHEALVEHERSLEMAKLAESLARKNRFHYEMMLAAQIRTNVLFDRQELSRAMTEIASGVRFAGRHEQFRSLGVLYFQASGIYFSMGSYDRCLAYLRKALDLAERLGDARNALVYLTRFGMVYQSMGQYGNALRFLDRASKTVSNVTSPDERVKLHLVRLDIGLDLNLDGLDAILMELSAFAENEMRKHQEGYYHLLLGRFNESRSEDHVAKFNYDSARDSYLSSSIVDDAVLASARLALLCLRTGDGERYSSLKEYLEEEVPKVESENVRALYNCVRLEEVLEDTCSSSDKVAQAELCEEQRNKVTEVPAQLMLDQRLFTVWALLDRASQARLAFARFHGAVRRIVANLPDREVAKRFLSRSDVAGTLSEYQAWEARQKSARN